MDRHAGIHASTPLVKYETGFFIYFSFVNTHKHDTEHPRTMALAAHEKPLTNKIQSPRHSSFHACMRASLVHTRHEQIKEKTHHIAACLLTQMTSGSGSGNAGTYISATGPLFIESKSQLWMEMRQTNKHTHIYTYIYWQELADDRELWKWKLRAGGSLEGFITYVRGFCIGFN